MNLKYVENTFQLSFQACKPFLNLHLVELTCPVSNICDLGKLCWYLGLKFLNGPKVELSV